MTLFGALCDRRHRQLVNPATWVTYRMLHKAPSPAELRWRSFSPTSRPGRFGGEVGSAVRHTPHRRREREYEAPRRETVLGAVPPLPRKNQHKAPSLVLPSAAAVSPVGETGFRSLRHPDGLCEAPQFGGEEEVRSLRFCEALVEGGYTKRETAFDFGYIILIALENLDSLGVYCVDNQSIQLRASTFSGRIGRRKAY